MINIKALVFDAYGTLFDVNRVIQKAEQIFPNRGREISTLWRQKQLEYTWLRSLMGRYKDFWKINDEALFYTLDFLNLDTSVKIRKILLSEYLYLKPYPEVPGVLNNLKNYRQLSILSNGTPRMLQSMITYSGLNHVFSSVISVDKIKLYKPFPGVYQLAPWELGIPREHILFVSSNTWDVAGAKSYGFKVCWINRSNTILDKLNFKPDLIIKSLNELL